MSFGLRVMNGSNILIIDELYRNLAVRASGTFSSLNNGDFIDGFAQDTWTSYVDVPWSASAPLVAVSPGKDTNGVYMRYGGFARDVAGSGTTRFGFQQSATWGSYGDSRYYIFDFIGTPASNPHGLRTWNQATGQIIFDGALTYMRTIGFAGHTATYTPGSKRYAFHESGYYKELAIVDVDPDNDRASRTEKSPAYGWDSANSRYVSTMMETEYRVTTASNFVQPLLFNDSWIALDVTNY